MFEFDLILTKIQSSTRHKRRNKCTKSNSLILSLTWVGIKSYLQPVTTTGAHIESQTFFKFDLTLTEMQSSTRRQRKSTRKKKKPILYLSLTWIWLTFNLPRETRTRAHVQTHIHFCEFDVSLTKSQSSSK